MDAQTGHSMLENGANQSHLAEILGSGPLFWSARDAVIVAEAATGRIVLWNPAAEEVFGYPAEEAVGMPSADLFPENVRDDYHAAMVRYAAASADELKGYQRTFELPARQKMGVEVFVEFSASPFKRGDATYLLGIVRDCTERKQMEAERDALLAKAREAARRVEELASLKADFSAMVAHELGTPLAGISAMVELLNRDGLTLEDRKRIRASIAAEIHLLQRLVADVHGTGTNDHDYFAVCLEPTPVATLLVEAAASLQSQLVHHHFVMESAPTAKVLADHERIGQVLRNLLSNAAKYTPAGTEVTLRATRKNNRIHFEVSDRGHGVAPSDVSHIFSKFGRGQNEEEKRKPGVGLGLYLSRRIIQAHGGDLVLVSNPGEGATFSFDLEEVI